MNPFWGAIASVIAHRPPVGSHALSGATYPLVRYKFPSTSPGPSVGFHSPLGSMYPRGVSRFIERSLSLDGALHSLRYHEPLPWEPLRVFCVPPYPVSHHGPFVAFP